MKRINTKQHDYLYDEFCQQAKYIEGALQPYVVSCCGKILRSTDTEDLFNQYLVEVRRLK